MATHKDEDVEIYLGLKFWKKRRHVVALIIFLIYFNLFALSTNLNVVIVAITSSHSFGNSSTSNKRSGTGIIFLWVFVHLHYWWVASFKNRRKFFINFQCISFIYIYFCCARADKIKQIFPGITTIWSWLLLGASTWGVVFPSVNVLWSKWAPVKERASLVSFGLSGCFMGDVYISSVSGPMCQHCGWPAMFYVTGYFSFLLGTVCGKLVKNEPDEDPCITKKELAYISSSIEKCPKMAVPWKTLLTSVPHWATIVSHFVASWGLFTIMIELPTYLNGVLNFNLIKIGFLCALLYLVNCLMLQFSRDITDKLFKTGRLSKTNIRKCFICSSFIAQMICINLAGLLRNYTVVVICFVMTVGMDAFVWSNLGVNRFDIGTQFADIITYISYTFAIIAKMLSPLIVGLVVRDKTDYFQWQCLFAFLGSIYLFGAVFYGIFGSAELQEWAK